MKINWTTEFKGYIIPYINHWVNQGYILIKIRPYVFERGDEVIIFNKQSDIIKGTKLTRPKTVCKDCGQTMIPKIGSSGAIRCRCEKCHKKYVREKRENKAAIIISKSDKEKLDNLGKEWGLRYPEQIVKKLLANYF